jgi:penicillin-insensitive murein endopeptidase
VLVFIGPLAGCVGLFAEDGSSVSVGTHARGALLRGVELPEEGAGYRVPEPWRVRHRQFATEEVVRWLTGAFGRVAREYPGSLAEVGDLSSQGGGRSFQHKSHGSGRDVDIFYYAVDRAGQPLRPDRAMFRFNAAGEAVGWSPPTPDRDRRHPPLSLRSLARLIHDPLPPARFDARRTWALVRAMLSDPSVEVQWIFIHRALADLLLREGPTADDDPALVARAAALMHQPSDAQPHDDHMHVRVYCEPSDRALGCQDRGPQRWWKKRWKYMATAPTLSAPGVDATTTASAATNAIGTTVTPPPASASSAPAIPAASGSVPTPSTFATAPLAH